jgi:hypothetical protein
LLGLSVSQSLSVAAVVSSPEFCTILLGGNIPGRICFGPGGALECLLVLFQPPKIITS